MINTTSTIAKVVASIQLHTKAELSGPSFSPDLPLLCPVHSPTQIHLQYYPQEFRTTANFKGSITYKNTESLYYTPETNTTDTIYQLNSNKKRIQDNCI